MNKESNIKNNTLENKSSTQKNFANKIYLDANAKATLRPEAKTSITEYLSSEQNFANPSAIYTSGRNSREVINSARSALLHLLGLKNQIPSHHKDRTIENEFRVVFTSGGTEACNTLVSGFISPFDYLYTSSNSRTDNQASPQVSVLPNLDGLCIQGSRNAQSPFEIITSSIEHSAMLESIRYYCNKNFKIHFVPPNSQGLIDSEKVLPLVNSRTILVSIMLANNETGVVQPLLEIISKIRTQGFKTKIITDATQAIGKVKISYSELFEAGLNGLCLSGHKLGSLTGVGAMILHNNSSEEFEPLMLGGPQENKLRAGSENILGILSLGKVAEVLKEQQNDEVKKLTWLREFFWKELEKLRDSFPKNLVLRIAPDEMLCKEPTQVLSNTLLVRFCGIRAEDLIVALDLAGVECSKGAACSSGKQLPSHVLSALGVSEESSKEIIRFSLNWDASEEVISEAVTRIKTVLINFTL